MPGLLDPDETANALTRLPLWTAGPRGLVRSLDAPDFPTAVQIVDAVAQAAEEMDHHPDIDIRWRTLTFACTTHSAGGITARDVDLAHRIDAVAVAHGAA
ncbi:MAG: 4a-hydroxytetrahydrobiopterin dehydratase [Actinomycetes bacterium]